jgi:hypothetical protein
MTNLSPKQELLKNYLIKKIGFLEDSFLNKYISIQELVSSKFKALGRRDIKWDNELKKYIQVISESNEIESDESDFAKTRKFNIIDLLFIELRIRKNEEFVERTPNLNFVSASDIANFTYCPVSFAISKSFELPKLDSTIYGSSQHELHKLIKYIKPFKVTKYDFSDSKEFKSIEVDKILSYDEYVNEDNKGFFDELAKSSIIFYGHDTSESRRTFFKSSKGNYIGQPDYIFQNDVTNEKYVVEEKFQYVPKDPSTFYYNNYSYSEEQNIQKKRTSKIFFDNHINQVSSYIYGISEHEIKYGFLVYWKYEIDDGTPKIVACSVLRVLNTITGREKLRETFKALSLLIAERGGVFDLTKRSPAKCASCVSNFLCGHKTGRYTQFGIPYSKAFLKLQYVPFPEELKKNPPPDAPSNEDIPL